MTTGSLQLASSAATSKSNIKEARKPAKRSSKKMTKRISAVIWSTPLTSAKASSLEVRRSRPLANSPKPNLIWLRVTQLWSHGRSCKIRWSWGDRVRASTKALRKTCQWGSQFTISSRRAMGMRIAFATCPVFQQTRTLWSRTTAIWWWASPRETDRSIASTTTIRWGTLHWQRWSHSRNRNQSIRGGPSRYSGLRTSSLDLISTLWRTGTATMQLLLRECSTGVS